MKVLKIAAIVAGCAAASNTEPPELPLDDLLGEVPDLDPPHAAAHFGKHPPVGACLAGRGTKTALARDAVSWT